MQHVKFHYPDLDSLRRELSMLGVTLPLSEDTAVLRTPVQAGAVTLHNRLAIQPMEGCDGTADGAPDELTAARYDRFADSGAGLIWGEACAVVREGRANPRQLWIHRENLDAFKRLTERIRERSIRKSGFAPVLILQITHSGRYAKPDGVPAPLIGYSNPIFEGDHPIDPSRIVSDDYLASLPERFGEAARLAQEAGFDGADIKCCHRYLFSEMMSAYTRAGRYGGSFENRTRVYFDSVRAARAAVKGDFLITSRFNAYDGFPHPYGFGVREGGDITPDLGESQRVVDILSGELGYTLLDITIGNPYFNPHVNRPYDMGGYVPPEHPLEGVARMFDCIGQIKRAHPELTVISSGHTYLRALAPYLAAGAIHEGISDIAGFGRMAFAYPEFAQDMLEGGALDPKKVCLTCGKCTELMRAGTVSGCVIRNPYYTKLYREVLGK